MILYFIIDFNKYDFENVSFKILFDEKFRFFKRAFKTRIYLIFICK